MSKFSCAVGSSIQSGPWIPLCTVTTSFWGCVQEKQLGTLKAGLGLKRSSLVFSASQLLCARGVPTLGKMILLHWCTTLYSTTWQHFTVLLETDSSSTLELNFCRRLYPHDLHATRIFLSGFHFNPPLRYSTPSLQTQFLCSLQSFSLFCPNLGLPRLSSGKLHLQLCSFYSSPQCKCWPRWSLNQKTCLAWRRYWTILAWDGS